MFVLCANHLCLSITSHALSVQFASTCSTSLYVHNVISCELFFKTRFSFVHGILYMWIANTNLTKQWIKTIASVLVIQKVSGSLLVEFMIVWSLWLVEVWCRWMNIDFRSAWASSPLQSEVSLPINDTCIAVWAGPCLAGGRSNEVHTSYRCRNIT